MKNLHIYFTSKNIWQLSKYLSGLCTSYYLIERPSILRIIDLGSLWAIWAYSKIFLITQDHKNIVKSLLRLHSNICKIICKNNKKKHIPEPKFWEFQNRFFSFLYLWILRVKQVSLKNTPSMGCFYDIYIDFLA